MVSSSSKRAPPKAATGFREETIPPALRAGEGEGWLSTEFGKQPPTPPAPALISERALQEATDKYNKMMAPLHRVRGSRSAGKLDGRGRNEKVFGPTHRGYDVPVPPPRSALFANKPVPPAAAVSAPEALLRATRFLSGEKRKGGSKKGGNSKKRKTKKNKKQKRKSRKKNSKTKKM